MIPACLCMVAHHIGWICKVTFEVTDNAKNMETIHKELHDYDTSLLVYSCSSQTGSHVKSKEVGDFNNNYNAWRGAMQKICPVCPTSQQMETRTAEDKLPILFTEAFWGCREWSEPRCNCLISCGSLCLEKICSRLLCSRMKWKNEMKQWASYLPPGQQ